METDWKNFETSIEQIRLEVKKLQSTYLSWYLVWLAQKTIGLKHAFFPFIHEF